MCLCNSIYNTSLEMGHLERVCSLFVVCCFGVAKQEQFVMRDVRLFPGSGVLFGGVVEVLTPNNGWEKVCFDDLDAQIADIVCLKRGFDEGAMSVRQATRLGVSVEPLPSLACHIAAVDGVDTAQCQYATVCTDHAFVVCNYPGFLGCYSHTRKAPSLDEAVFSYSNMTIQFCLTLCREAGYPYAGVAFGQECYCEQHMLTGFSSRKLGNQDCFLPCVGDPHQICGGGTAAGIYDSRLGSCNAVYTDVEGALATPGFPGYYAPNKECSWLVDVPNAANITVQIKSFELNLGDYLRIETAMDQFVAFTGGSGGIHYKSSGFRLNAHLSFTFTGGIVTVTFNSSVTSTGAQGSVVTYAAGGFNTPGGVTIETQMPTVTSSQITSKPTTSQSLIPSTQTMTSPVGNPRTSAPHITTALNDDQTEIIPTTILVAGAQSKSSVTTEDTVVFTPRFITMATDNVNTTSVAVIVAIAVGIILIILLILTAAVLFTASFKHVQHRSNAPNSMAFAIAASPTYDEDRLTDSGIFDPGYQTVDVEDPIYLSIRNDPRATHYNSSSRNGEHYNNAFASRNESVKTTKTDHDYQSVHGLSRKNTEKSYISIYPENKTSDSGEIVSTETCKIAEDGYMVPTPKNSTQSQQTRF